MKSIRMQVGELRDDRRLEQLKRYHFIQEKMKELKKEQDEIKERLEKAMGENDTLFAGKFKAVKSKVIRREFDVKAARSELSDEQISKLEPFFVETMPTTNMDVAAKIFGVELINPFVKEHPYSKLKVVKQNGRKS